MLAMKGCIFFLVCVLSLRGLNAAYVSVALIAEPYHTIVDLPSFSEGSQSADSTICYDISQYSGNSNRDSANYARVTFDGGRLTDCRVELFFTPCGIRPRLRRYQFPLEYRSNHWEAVVFKSVNITCYGPGTIDVLLAIGSTTNATGTALVTSLAPLSYFDNLHC